MRSSAFKMVASLPVLICLVQLLAVVVLMLPRCLGSPLTQHFLLHSVVTMQENSQANGMALPTRIEQFKTLYVDSRTVFIKREVIQEALEKLPQLAALNLALSSDRAKADLLIQVNRPFLTFDWTYVIVVRVTKETLYKGKVVAVDGKTAARLLSEAVVRDLEAARRQTAAAEAVAARQHQESSPPASTASRGERRQTLQNHRNFHSPPKNSDATQSAGEHPRTVLLLSSDLDAGGMECGAIYSLEEAGKVTKLTDEFSGEAEDLLSISDSDCRRIESEIDRFYSVLFEYRKGPERFYPLLAAQVQTNVFDDLTGIEFTNAQRSRLLAYYLDGLFYTMLMMFEEIEIADSDLENIRESEIRNPKQLEQMYDRMLARIRKQCQQLGLLEQGHLAAVLPLISHWRTRIVSHQLKKEDSAAAGATVIYHFQWSICDFMFVLQSGHLKLQIVYLRT